MGTSRRAILPTDRNTTRATGIGTGLLLAGGGECELMVPVSTARATAEAQATRHAVNVGELVLGPTERAYLQRVIESGRLSYGPFTKKFESAFAERHGCQFGCFCCSGSAALQLAITALIEQRGWKPGDEVLVPSVTFVATVNVVLQAGLKPILVDVRPDTYTMDPDLIERAITPRTRCLMPVHLLGLPADMGPMVEIADKHRLAIIEDSCETMFAEYQGRPVGSFGDVACFSTYVAHFLVTGVGGLTTTNDPALARLIRSLMNHGRDGIYLSIDDDRRDASNFHEVVDRRFRFERVGFSYRCTEMEAAIGLAQLESCDSIIQARRDNAAEFSRRLADLSDVLQIPVALDDRDHAHMVYGLVVKSGPMKPLVHFLEDRGIETRDMLPLIHQPVYREWLGPEVGERFPVANRLWDRAFYIGCHQHLDDADRDHVVSVIHEYFGGATKH